MRLRKDHILNVIVAIWNGIAMYPANATSVSSNRPDSGVFRLEVKQKSHIVFLSSLIALATLEIIMVTGLFFAGVISSSIAIPLLVLTLVFTGVLAARHATKYHLSQPPRKILQPTTKDYKSILQFHARTVSSLKEISLGSVAPVTTTSSYSIWKIPSTSTYLISAVGDIASPRFHTSLPNLMLVNAANAYMLSGGGGTNLAFTSAVSFKGWINSTEGKQKLQVGECTVGKWENPDGTCNEQNSGLPNYLAQLLGPNACECHNNLSLCQQYVFQAYENCFHKGTLVQSHHIQLPLISSHNFAPAIGETVEENDLYTAWINTVKSSFVQAVIAFARKHPRYPMLIVIVNKDSPII